MGAERDSQLHAVDADSDAANCCHVDPAHTFRDAALVSIAGDTESRISPGVVTEHAGIFWASTSDTVPFPTAAPDYAAGRGRALYLTTLRIRI